MAITSAVTGDSRCPLARNAHEHIQTGRDAAYPTATTASPRTSAPFAVHVDVDVLDFTDAPLAENTSGRNIGPTLDQLAAALNTVMADPRWRALSIGELNPTRTAGGPSELTRLVAVLTDAFAHAGQREPQQGQEPTPLDAHPRGRQVHQN